ncbi:hypothetical protein AK812_SmicGene11155 [Symbiodinium microadriaticum]|uniref:UBA domain-containing protein n=1 Tax=Symbiodinium microadriaticum TaxID=2951 RepID=A0A1Q9EDY2_SYMMI|nr:hypothetical protein AK812_SmicGene11155 [Symbiodinium microadriaticum]
MLGFTRRFVAGAVDDWCRSQGLPENRLYQERSAKELETEAARSRLCPRLRPLRKRGRRRMAPSFSSSSPLQKTLAHSLATWPVKLRVGGDTVQARHRGNRAMQLPKAPDGTRRLATAHGPRPPSICKVPEIDSVVPPRIAFVTVFTRLNQGVFNRPMRSISCCIFALQIWSCQSYVKQFEELQVLANGVMRRHHQEESTTVETTTAAATTAAPTTAAATTAAVVPFTPAASTVSPSTPTSTTVTSTTTTVTQTTTTLTITTTTLTNTTTTFTNTTQPPVPVAAAQPKVVAAAGQFQLSDGCGNCGAGACTDSSLEGQFKAHGSWKLHMRQCGLEASLYALRRLSEMAAVVSSKGTSSCPGRISAGRRPEARPPVLVIGRPSHSRCPRPPPERTGRLFFNTAEATEHAEAFGKEYANFEEVGLDHKVWVAAETNRVCYKEEDIAKMKVRDPDSKTWEEKDVAYLMELQKKKDAALARKEKFFASVDQRKLELMQSAWGFGGMKVSDLEVLQTWGFQEKQDQGAASWALHFTRDKGTIEAAEAWLAENADKPDLDKVTDEFVEEALGEIAVVTNSLPCAGGDVAASPGMTPVDDRKIGDPNPPEIKGMINQDLLQQVMEMGFTEVRSEKAMAVCLGPALQALYKTDNASLEHAVNWLAEHAEDIAMPLPFFKT